jgi:hypothetical protein
MLPAVTDSLPHANFVCSNSNPMLSAVNSTNGGIELEFLESMNPSEERALVSFSVENPRLFLSREGLVFRKRMKMVLAKIWMMITDL